MSAALNDVFEEFDNFGAIGLVNDGDDDDDDDDGVEDKENCLSEREKASVLRLHEALLEETNELCVMRSRAGEAELLATGNWNMLADMSIEDAAGVIGAFRSAGDMKEPNCF